MAPGHGCNAPEHDQPCALELCRGATSNRDAALALARWNALEDAVQAERGGRRVRSLRRAFERARDRALITLALAPVKGRRTRPEPRFRRRGRSRPMAVA